MMVDAAPYPWVRCHKAEIAAAIPAPHLGLHCRVAHFELAQHSITLIITCTRIYNLYKMEDDREMRPDEAMIVDSGEREHRRGVLG